MPEVEPERNLKPHRQCEIRRPSPPGSINTGGGVTIAKPAGYYFDIVWIDNEIARVGAKLTDDRGNEWVIAETFGSRPMPRSRAGLRPA